ncbi:MAG: hypothetical protein JWM98_2440 [Thermoleophilia bacterium]|nr:hypothetical protein [Thermoleophilia bacterium]
MPDPSILVAVLLLVALVESSPLVRLPVGLLLAVALLASGADLLPIALVGAAGVTLARLGLALSARRGRDRASAASPLAQAQREALRARLSGSGAYTRITFSLAALPGIPPTFLFPLLGAMRAPLWPALAGTLVGRTPLLALTTAVFAWLGRIGDGSDSDAALSLGILALALLVFRTFGLVDWRHRAETGKFRMRDADAGAMRMTGMFSGPGAEGGGSAGWSRADVGVGHDPADADIIEGEFLGEEAAGDDDPDDDPPPALPPTGLAPG